MMRWKMTDMTFEVKDSVSVAAETNDEQMTGGILGHAFQTLTMALTRAGVTSVVVVVAVAILIATVLIGFTANEAAALGHWCPRCD